MNKKAGLEIGINTIVILVIAMVVIGGGIAFIRGFFNLGESKLKEPFELADFGLKPSSTQPLVLQAGLIEIKTGAEKIIKGGFYNARSETNFKVIVDRCTPVFETTGEPPTLSKISNKPEMVSLPYVTAPSNAEVGFNVIIKGIQDGTESVTVDIGGSDESLDTKDGAKLTPGTYICTISARNVPDITNNPNDYDTTGTLATAPITLNVIS